MNRGACLASILGAFGLVAGGLTQAHHSVAIYDQQKSVTVSGTVREFQWTNPHSWIQVLVPAKDATGQVEEWSVEMGNPRQLFRNGWKPGTLKKGDAITVVIRPMRDGSKAGLYVSATDASGKHLGTDFKE
ncbi:MAG: DUF6152 family protein [Steroidobacteraceae bacterium]